MPLGSTTIARTPSSASAISASQIGAANLRMVATGLAMSLRPGGLQVLALLEPEHVVDDDRVTNFDAVRDLDRRLAALADSDWPNARGAVVAHDDLVGTDDVA